MRTLILLMSLGVSGFAQSPKDKDPRGEQIIVVVGNKSISNFTLYPAAGRGV